MPYKLEHTGGKRPWKIVKRDTGEVVGSSVSRAKAVASIAARTDAMKEEKKK